jgi:hypothetical protein
MQSNQDHQRIAAAFDRLFRTYPQFAQGNTAGELLRDRVEKAKVYFDAVVLYDERDVEAAVDAFLSGTAPGVNPSFAPPAPAVGAECRRQLNLRLDRERDRRPKLPPPDIERTPESQARVKELMERTVHGLRTPDSDDPAARHKRRMEKTNAYFDQERGYSVGDRDGHEDAA